MLLSWSLLVTLGDNLENRLVWTFWAFHNFSFFFFSCHCTLRYFSALNICTVLYLKGTILQQKNLTISVMQVNLWMHLRFQKSLGIAFCCVAKVLSSMKLIKCQETEVKLPLPHQAGIARRHFGKGANSGQTAYDCGSKIQIAIR